MPKYDPLKKIQKSVQPTSRANVSSVFGTKQVEIEKLLNGSSGKFKPGNLSNNDLKIALIDICMSAGIESKQILEDLVKSEKSSNFKDILIEIQLNLLKMLSNKIQKERKDRVKIEKQFEDLMSKYSKQMELIDEKMKS